jgi:hypothetical protein
MPRRSCEDRRWCCLAGPRGEVGCGCAARTVALQSPGPTRSPQTPARAASQLLFGRPEKLAATQRLRCPQWRASGRALRWLAHGCRLGADRVVHLGVDLELLELLDGARAAELAVATLLDAAFLEVLS